MEPENTELYMRKLKESIAINRDLLTLEGDTHKGLNDSNLQFQAILQGVFEQSQANLPFFESLTTKLTEDENQALIAYATQTTAAHQQFFEIWKAYKELETKTGVHLSVAAEKIKSFALD